MILIAHSKDRLEKLKKELEEKYFIKAKLIVKDLSERNAAKEVYDEIKSAGMSRKNTVFGVYPQLW